MFGIHDLTEYCSVSLKSIVNSLKVVNDTAERGIALIKKFNKSVREFLLRLVKPHRKVVTKRTKEEVTSHVSFFFCRLVIKLENGN